MNEIESTNNKLEKNSITFWDGIFIALAVFAGQLLAALIGGVLGGILISLGFIEMSQLEGVILAVAIILGFILAVWLVLRKRTLADSVWYFDKSHAFLIPVALLMLYSTSYCIGLIMENIPGYEGMLDDYSSMFDGINPILLLIGGGIIGPICEEIIFRGVILKEFLETYDPKRAIVYSAIIFGVIHFIPLQVFSAFFAGLILGYVYYKTKSLWIPIVMHVLNNVIAFSFGVEAEAEMARDYFNNEMLYWASFIIAGIICYGMYLIFERKIISPSFSTSDMT